MISVFFLRQMNDGPLCRCSSENMHFGIRHNVYPGEKVNFVYDLLLHLGHTAGGILSLAASVSLSHMSCLHYIVIVVSTNFLVRF